MSEEKKIVVKFTKTLKEAITPTKANEFAEGYDLTLIKVNKRFSNKTIRFDTGIAVQPPVGYHTRIVPRSSFSKTGWIMSNSVGIIDRDYTGNLMVCITRVDDLGVDIEKLLPYKGFQILVERSVNSEMIQVNELIETERGSGGFGSTDSKN